VAPLKIKALTSAAVAGLLRPSLADINVVSAPSVAASAASSSRNDARAQGDYESLITLSVTTAKQERSVAGTVFRTASRASCRSRASRSTPSSRLR
jgi:D-3-phosphoglycerate dehydrogenase